MQTVCAKKIKPSLTCVPDLGTQIANYVYKEDRTTALNQGGGLKKMTP